tara:strand:+ start:929 stop:2332 length:1404 start_codon:yes stop_codon:yes gene_type:complete
MLYNNKLPFFNNKISGDKNLLLSENEKNLTKSDIYNLAVKNKQFFNKKSLILFCGGNDSISISQYLSFLLCGQAILFFDSSADQEKIGYLIKKFKPEFIFLKNNIKLKKDYSILFRNKFYYFLKSNKKYNSPINKKLAILLSTSGSLKNSKFVKLSYENIFSNCMSISKYLKLNWNDRGVSTLPLHYSYGLSVLHSHIFYDRPFFCNNYSILQKQFWELIKDFKITNLSFVPYNYEILKRIGIEKFDLSKIKFLTVAGGKLSIELTLSICKILKKKRINFFSMYGQTEASPRISFIELKKLLKKPNSCGKSIPGGKIEIKKEKSSFSGEIIYYGKNIFKGYATDRLSCKKLINYKKLNTGDIGYKDKEGDLFILGRKKRNIKIFGVRVNLDRLEDLFKNEKINVICHNKDDLICIFYQKKNIDNGKIFKILRKNINFRENDIKLIYLKKFPRLVNNKIDYRALNNII